MSSLPSADLWRDAMLEDRRHPSVLGGMVRMLDSYEEVIWLALTSVPIPDSYVATIEGSTDIAT
jgi:hypothetical protein